MKVKIQAEAKIPDEFDQTWFRNHERQAYRLAMMSMMNNHLIEDFDVIKVRVKINGQWRTDRQK